jgi:hypothetical protein
MRFLVTLILTCLLATSAFAQDTDTHGKTDAGILAMGREDWVGYYTSQVDDSTAGWSRALSTYASVLRRRNQALPQRSNAEDFRRLLTDFGYQSLGIAANCHGRGTFWAHVYGEMECDVEEVIYALLGGPAEPSPPMMTSMVRDSIADLNSRIEFARSWPANGLADYDLAKADLRALRRDWQEIKRLAKNLSRADSDRVLTFCDCWATSVEMLPFQGNDE